MVQLSERDLRRRGWRVSPDPAVRHRDWTNRRTGEIVRVPVGIDPGFQHNAGRLDLVDDAVRIAQAKHGAGSIVSMPITDAADWQQYAIVGREATRELAAEAGGRGADGFDPGFRAALIRRMGDRIGGERVEVTAAADADSTAAAQRLRVAVEAHLPASWIRAGNSSRALVKSNGQAAGGSYHPGRKPPEMRLSMDPANAFHEYVHHLQQRLPAFNAAWARFYDARTGMADGSPEPLVASVYGAEFLVRRDQWIDDYMGFHDKRELAPRALQILTHGLYGQERIGMLAERDPLLLHLAIGFLLRFEP